MKKETKPELRFAGFTDDWEQRKLGEIAPLRGGFAFKSTNYTEKGIPIIRISNILSDGTVGSDFKFFDELPNDEEFLLHDGDALLAMSGATTGKVSILKAPKGFKYYQNQRVGYFTRLEKADYSYVSTIIRSDLFLSQLKNVLATGAQPNVSPSEIGNFEFPFPKDKKEQQRIGTFFRMLDSAITLHQRKCDALIKVKKSMLQKMFPKNGKSKPEVRFAGFTDDWEQRKLNELCTMHARIGWQNLRTTEFLKVGEYYLITGTDFNDGRIDFNTCHYVTKDRYIQDKNIQINNGSILITKDGTLGKVAYVDGLDKPATLNAGVFNVVISDTNEIDSKFLFQYLKAPFLMNYVSMRATGGTIKHLNQNILVDFPVILPSKKEQVELGDFFRTLDSAITLHQREVEKLTKLKKALLSKMFI